MSPIAIPPLSTSLSGVLFKYSQWPALVAFESPINNIPDPVVSSENELLSPNKCILIGGLSDGLIPVPYTEILQTECALSNWSLIQPILSSSYLGFGSGSLDRDTNEITSLLSYLKEHRNGEHFAIIGHSTGCQNIIHFLKHCEDKELSKLVKVVALQAPVSDREGPMADDKETYEKNIKIAKDMKKSGKENEMMPRNVFWAPITASRFLALQDCNGNNDFFSSDFTDEELIDKLSHISNKNDDNNGLHHALICFSGSDEYVPKHIIQTYY